MDEQAYLAVYKKLNQAQKKAVDTLDGPVLVVAGPGTGKTELLALRVANILRLRDVSPHNILCLTFTENGALNMRNRLASFIKQDAYRVGIYTFHAFANSIISRNPEYFYQAANFSQASDLDRAQIFTEIFETLPHKHALASFHSEEGYVYLKDMMDRIKHIKSGGYTPSEYSALVESIAKEYPAINKVLHGWPEGRASIKNISLYDPIVQSLHSIGTLNATYLATTLAQSIERASENRKMEAISDWKKKYTINDGEQVVLKDSYLVDKIRGVAEIYSIYTEMLHKKGLYDFDDVIIEVGHVLRNNSVLKNELEEQYQYILIDEFQDTNDAQMSLVHAISSSYIHEGRPNVMVVGDDDQAVYKFQGAEISNIINFRNNTYKNVEIIVLDKNYRSHQAVLDLARSIVTQGIGRLENKYGDISKVLSQGNASIKESKIAITEYGSDIEEFTRTAQYVHKLIHCWGF
jgi:DNA helicase-2/ATP-dependent DNA helicase PcrA